MHTSRFTTLKPCLLAMALLALLASGCAHDERPLLIERYDSHGEAFINKRIERHGVRDFWHHWKRAIYRSPSAQDLEQAGHDGVGIIDQFGEPEWVRGPFTSLEGQKIDEWLYLNEDRLFQFAGKQLIFEGPVTDYEGILLERGYPDKREAILTQDNHRIDTLFYRQPFWANFEQFHFVDGKLNQSQEGN